MKELGFVVLIVFATLALASCDSSEEGGGVCLHDFGGAYECFSDWNQSGCEDNGWDWVSGQTCSELGYTQSCGGYSWTRPGECPL